MYQPHVANGFRGQPLANFPAQQPLVPNFPQETPPAPSPTISIVMKDNTDKRLFFGSVSSEINEQKMRQIIEDVAGPRALVDCYVNSEKHFAFLDFETREQATLVKNALDGRALYGRVVIIRRANHKCSVFVKDIPESVSNEILYKAFEQFGAVDRACIITDHFGKSLSHGFVEFSQKRSATNAVNQCSGENLFFLTEGTPPVRVAAYVPRDAEDGCPEYKMNRTPQQSDEVSVSPHFNKKNAFAQEQYKKWRDLIITQRKEVAGIKAKHKATRDALLRDIKKTVGANHAKVQEERREKQLKEWQAVQDKEREVARAAQELAQLRHRIHRPGATPAGFAPNPYQRGPAIRGGSNLLVGPQRPIHPGAHPSLQLPGGALRQQPRMMMHHPAYSTQSPLSAPTIGAPHARSSYITSVPTRGSQAGGVASFRARQPPVIRNQPVIRNHVDILQEAEQKRRKLTSKPWSR